MNTTSKQTTNFYKTNVIDQHVSVCLVDNTNKSMYNFTKQLNKKKKTNSLSVLSTTHTRVHFFYFEIKQRTKESIL